MSENYQESKKKQPSKKILEKSPMSGIAVPIAIILVGALIIFGITKMLSSGKNYKDLVGELQSKTFGNRWVAAFELSKYIASEKIPKEDYPWLMKNLSQVYDTTIDGRTKVFVVRAIAALNDKSAAPVLIKALADKDKDVQFHATVALGSMKDLEALDWSSLVKNAGSSDEGLKQVSLMAMAEHKVPQGESVLLKELGNESDLMRYTAAIGLVSYQNPQSLGVLARLLETDSSKPAGKLNGLQLEALQQNALTAVEKSKWNAARKIVEKAASNQGNIKISTKARQVLNLLKK